jgi:hypothetical protein
LNETKTLSGLPEGYLEEVGMVEEHEVAVTMVEAI